MDDAEFFSILGFVKISSCRTKTIKSIGHNFKIPSEIAKEISIPTSRVSTSLSDLKKKGLVVCINEDVRKGRLYKCTPLGLEILKYLT